MNSLILPAGVEPAPDMLVQHITGGGSANMVFALGTTVTGGAPDASRTGAPVQIGRSPTILVMDNSARSGSGLIVHRRLRRRLMDVAGRHGTSS